LWQKDISNNEAATIGATAYPQVFYSNNTAERADKIQDMLWPLGYVPRPLKYYWFDPPKTDELVLSRTVTLTNDQADPSKYITFKYTGTVTASPGDTPGGPPPPIEGGSV
jgi:hypothetical protein